MAAAERQPRDADRRTRSSRYHHAVLEQLLVDVDQSRAGADRRPRVAARRPRPSRYHHAVLEQLLVDVDQSRAGADRSRSRRRIRRDTTQTRDVDDDAAASGIARVAMSSGPRDDTDRVPLR